MSITSGSLQTVCDFRGLGVVPGEVRVFVDLGKVKAQLVFHARGGDLQHPGCRVELPLYDGHPRYPLLTQKQTPLKQQSFHAVLW